MNRRPLIFAIVILVLPVLYVGSYLALVRPGGYGFAMDGSPLGYAARCSFDPPIVENYRYGGKYADCVFWPLEQIDRWVRPWKWDSLWGLE